MKTARRAACALFALAAWGCSDDPELVIVIEHPTLIEVNPSEFLGTVPCLEATGAMRRYVATVFDVTSDADAGTTENFALPSSGPVPCTAPVGFSLVIPGHHYAAEVDGYDRADLAPLAPGARVMVDPETGERVEPRWTTSCGRGEAQSTLAVSELARRTSHCEPLVDASPSDAPAEVHVSLDSVLGELACGSADGEVSHFTVRHPATNLEVSAECGDEAVLSELPPGSVLELELLVFAPLQTTATWGSVCTASPRAGVQLQASCAPLSSQGTLEIDLASALSSVSLECDEGLRELVATAGDTVKRVSPPGCSSSLRLGDLPPGEASVKITTTLADGSAGPTLTCSGMVQPGLSVRATCAADG